tara:strand:+ start:196 stop:537 length:342 start_codon:yes stop_codon:yes gene_type:complete
MNLPTRLSEPGPILSYLAFLKTIGKDELAQDTIDAVRVALRTEEGNILLELLEKSISATPSKTSEDLRALDQRNAQSFIAHDLRRILSSECDRKSDTISTASRPGRRGRRPKS